MKSISALHSTESVTASETSKSFDNFTGTVEIESEIDLFQTECCREGFAPNLFGETEYSKDIDLFQPQNFDMDYTLAVTIELFACLITFVGEQKCRLSKKSR